MQLRRVVLLFALVLGLSALVAALVPAPDTRDERDEPTSAPGSISGARAEPHHVRFQAVPRPKRAPERTVPAGSSVSLKVSVKEPGDVVVDGLGLRATADPLTPAELSVFSPRSGRYDVAFEPVTGRRVLVGSLVFAKPPVRRQRRRP